MARGIPRTAPRPGGRPSKGPHWSLHLCAGIRKHRIRLPIRQLFSGSARVPVLWGGAPSCKEAATARLEPLPAAGGSLGHRTQMDTQKAWL